MLRWTLEYGDPQRVAFFDGMVRWDSVPKPLQDRPVLDVEYQPFWKAFLFLNRRRQRGMGTSPIDGAELNSYLQRRGITDPDVCVDYETFVDALDVAYLDWHDTHKPPNARQSAEQAAILPRLPKP